MKNLTPHESRILDLTRKYPEIVSDRSAREKVASEISITEKTLRNRIADLKRYGLLKVLEEKSKQTISHAEELKFEREINLFDYAKIIWDNKWILMQIIGSISILSVIVTLLLPVWYKATTVILPPTSQSSSLGALGLLGDIGFGNLLGGDNSQNQYLAVLKSHQLRRKVIKRFNLQNKYNLETMQETFDALNNNTKVEVGDEMQISISVWDKEQDIVADMANYMIFCLDSINIEFSTSSAKNNREFIQGRIEEIIDSLYVLEQKFTKVMEDEGILALEDQVRVGVEKAAEIQFMIMVKEVELEITKVAYQGKSPKIQIFERELESLKNKYLAFAQGNIDEQLVPSFKKVPRLKLTFEQLARKIDYYTKLLAFLGPQFEQSKIEEVKDISTVQILDQAITPEKKDKPKRTLIVLVTFFVSTFLAISAIIIKDSSKTS